MAKVGIERFKALAREVDGDMLMDALNSCSRNFNPLDEFNKYEIIKEEVLRRLKVYDAIRDVMDR